MLAHQNAMGSVSGLFCDSAIHTKVWCVDLSSGEPPVRGALGCRLVAEVGRAGRGARGGGGGVAGVAGSDDVGFDPIPEGVAKVLRKPLHLPLDPVQLRGVPHVNDGVVGVVSLGPLLLRIGTLLRGHGQSPCVGVGVVRVLLGLRHDGVEVGHGELLVPEGGAVCAVPPVAERDRPVAGTDRLEEVETTVVVRHHALPYFL